MELTDEELDALMHFYTDMIPDGRNRLRPIDHELKRRGLLDIYTRSDSEVILYACQSNGSYRYRLSITHAGLEAVAAQSDLQMALSCARIGKTVEAIEIVRRLPVDALPVVLSCGDEHLRRAASKLVGVRTCYIR